LVYYQVVITNEKIESLLIEILTHKFFSYENKNYPSFYSVIIRRNYLQS
jgi:hypothetical protein